MNRPTQGHISTNALRHNLGLIRSKLSNETRVMGVVKANCYGHEASICLPILCDAGVDIFGVATIGEAEILRQLGLSRRIVLLTTPFYSERSAFVTLDIEPLISDIETAQWLSATAEAAGKVLRAHIYIDTGMTRNGAKPEDAAQLTEKVALLPGLHIQGLSSHFATSESLDRSFALRQIATFDQVYRELCGTGWTFEDVHIANSGGILNFPEAHYTLVRPGLSLYGYHPLEELQTTSGLEPVMSVKTAISSLSKVPAKTSISYGRRYFTERDSIIATLPIGYGDGIMRLLTGKLDVLIAGQSFPVVGTICMDEVMVNLGSNDSGIQVGEEVTLIGRSGDKQITAWDIASSIGTIPYEITTAMANRLPRVIAERSEEGVETELNHAQQRTIE
ncbi:MAG: alanine racemase [Candidatus Kapaibacterium sp.]